MPYDWTPHRPDDGRPLAGAERRARACEVCGRPMGALTAAEWHLLHRHCEECSDGCRFCDMGEDRREE